MYGSSTSRPPLSPFFLMNALQIIKKEKKKKKSSYNYYESALKKQNSKTVPQFVVWMLIDPDLH